MVSAENFSRYQWEVYKSFDGKKFESSIHFSSDFYLRGRFVLSLKWPNVEKVENFKFESIVWPETFREVVRQVFESFHLNKSGKSMYFHTEN